MLKGVVVVILLSLSSLAFGDPKPCYSVDDFAGRFRHRSDRTDLVTIYKKGINDLVGEFTWFGGNITGYLFTQYKKLKDSDLCASVVGTFSAKDRTGKRSTGTVVLKADAITPGFGRVHNLDDLKIEFTVEGTTKVEYWTGNRER